MFLYLFSNALGLDHFGSYIYTLHWDLSKICKIHVVSLVNIGLIWHNPTFTADVILITNNASEETISGVLYIKWNLYWRTVYMDTPQHHLPSSPDVDPHSSDPATYRPIPHPHILACVQRPPARPGQVKPWGPLHNDWGSHPSVRWRRGGNQLCPFFFSLCELQASSMWGWQCSEPGVFV